MRCDSGIKGLEGMQSALTAKEQLNGDTPLFLFDCTLADGTVQHWSSQTITRNGVQYDGRVLRHNLFEAQLASDTQIGGAPKLNFELANADSRLSEIEQETGFKGAQLTVQSVFFDLGRGIPTTDGAVVFRGLMNPPDLITETIFRLSAMNRMSMQRSVVPDVRVQRMCPWRFPATEAQRIEAVDGGSARGKYSPFFRCGYSPDQANGTGNLNGDEPFTTCDYTRSSCERRGMFIIDSSGRRTGRFGGIEYVPPTILVRGAGQKNSQLSAVQDNTARYNDFVPLVYGTQWHAPDVVFSRNDGNLTRMEVLLGMGEIEGILKVLVDDVEIPRGVAGVNMTSTGWYNLVSAGSRSGQQDGNFADGKGVPLGDPYGSMAYLSVVVPNRINNGTSIPTIQVLMQGLKLWQFDTDGNWLGDRYSSNPAWVLLDILMRSGYSLAEIDGASFARAAQYADELITVNDPVGGTVQIPRFQCQFALKSRRSAGEIIRSIRNGSRLYLVLNTLGLLEARIENTFALQQPVKPPGSNAENPFSGGWPAYEFDAGSIARRGDGSASVKLSSKGAQDTPNRLSIEFQDSFNQYQQDSLSLGDEDDADLCGQQVAATWDAIGISTFNQATRMLLLGLNRAIQGNLFIEFETSVKALGLIPGDLITVTYLKENLQRTPFRVTRITPGASFRTAVITAQLHDDLWYSDTVTGITGGRGRQTGRGSGLPAPVSGTVLDPDGTLQLGITEVEVAGGDGSTSVELSVSFATPSGKFGTLAAPLIGLAPTISTTGGSFANDRNLFYAVSAVDDTGAESSLSFIAQATTSTAGTDTNSVVVDGIALPANAVSFHVYRGDTPELLFRIASNQEPAPSFFDTGFPSQTLLPPDPQYDHVNIYWRWELLPETAAGIHSATTVGNTILQLKPDQYKAAAVRITHGKGAGQERKIAGNSATAITVEVPWGTEPDATSRFVIAENSWRIGARGAASPIAIDVPERIGSGVQISARAANVAEDQAVYELSPLTRWVLGQSGGLAADADVPPAPLFGLRVSPSRWGVLEPNGVGFTDLVNTRGIIAGTYKFHFYDEIKGKPPSPLGTSIGATDSTMAFGSDPAPGTLLQIGSEIIQIIQANSDSTVEVIRGVHSTQAVDHSSTDLVYTLKTKVVIVPFIKSFFGSSASGDWQYSFELPSIRLASAELYMTNALGDGAVAINTYTTTADSGLRTFAGGQYSFQIGGYLAIQTAAAPSVIVDADRSVRDVFGIVSTPATGAGLGLQVNRNGIPYASIEFEEGATAAKIVDGFGLPTLKAGDILSLDITGVGTTNPGSDLTLMVRL